MTEKSIASRLAMDHLKDVVVEDTADLKQAVESEAGAASQPSEDPREDLRNQREYPFQFSWTDSRGKTWEGAFTNKILSIGQRQLVGIMRAKLAAGMPLESLDSMTAELNLLIAHMTFSLTEQPSWAEDLRKLDSIGLVQAIYAEVLAHEATFFGYDKDTAEG